jgi:hypothetical protein
MNRIEPTTEWQAELHSKHTDEWISTNDYRRLRTESCRWLKEGYSVKFRLKRASSGKVLSYPVELVKDVARVNVDGDLVTFSDAVIIMKEKLEEDPSG